MYVTVGNIADFLPVHPSGRRPGQSDGFLVEKDAPGVSIKRTLEFTHHLAFKHPEFLFEDVVVDGIQDPQGNRRRGFNMTKDWFVEARLGIAARCVGGAERC